MGAEAVSAPGGGEVTVTEQMIEDPTQMAFLEGTTHVTTLAREFPQAEGESKGDVRMVHTGPDFGYIAAPGLSAVTYSPASTGAVSSLWDEWAGAWE